MLWDSTFQEDIVSLFCLFSDVVVALSNPLTELIAHLGSNGYSLPIKHPNSARSLQMLSASGRHQIQESAYSHLPRDTYQLAKLGPKPFRPFTVREA